MAAIDFRIKCRGKRKQNESA